MRPRLLLVLASFMLSYCASPPATDQAPGTEDSDGSAGALGIRAQGDEELSPDLGQIPDELKRVFDHIDANIDDHVLNLRKWIQQPSISNSGEGIPESAQMVQGFFDQLGCQDTRVFDVPMTEWGQPGNPVVYANCDYGASQTLLVYWMYDTMPVTQPDAWVVPPFEGRLAEHGPFKKVMIGRGATNSKGPQMTQWNAFKSIVDVTGKLPVNLIFVAEGDEERMSIGLRQWVREHHELVADAEALFRTGRQGRSGGGGLSGSSEGCVYIELTTSGRSWGRGPLDSNIHGSRKRAADSPAWRHIEMLSTLISDNGNTIMVPGFHDKARPLRPFEEEMLQRTAAAIDLKVAAENVGVARWTSDDPYEYAKMARYGISLNLDGIWAGNMYPAGAGAILPNKITSKHNIRYVPEQDGLEIVQKIRDFLDATGYEDVEMTIIGDVPWSEMSFDSDVARAFLRMYDIFGIRYSDRPDEATILGGYWPAYLFVNDEVSPIQIPIAGGGAGHGGGAHAANEFWVIEGSGKVYGMAGAEKSVATALYAYAGLLPPAADGGTGN